MALLCGTEEHDFPKGLWEPPGGRLGGEVGTKLALTWPQVRPKSPQERPKTGPGAAPERPWSGPGGPRGARRPPGGLQRPILGRFKAYLGFIFMDFGDPETRQNETRRGHDTRRPDKATAPSSGEATLHDSTNCQKVFRIHEGRSHFTRGQLAVVVERRRSNGCLN